MKKVFLPQLLDRFQKLAPGLGGIFSFSDLCNLIGAGSDIKNAKVIKRLVRLGVLHRVYRGFYSFGKEPNLWVLGSRIKPRAYVSMDSVLAKNGLVGTIPANSVSLVYPGRKTEIETPWGSYLRYYSIQPSLIFGIAPLKNGVQVADSEKAYLDLMYFYTKGARFVFDPICEVVLRKLDLNKLRKYLKRYRNPKFVKFIEGITHEID